MPGDDAPETASPRSLQAGFSAGISRHAVALISAKSGELFNAWQGNVDKLEAGEEHAQKAITQAISGLHDQVMVELRALN